ncbi:uncharacterized protein LOC6572122 [Drosophila mojavensis]|uniref:uncharacterized protein LOC6572122 n=1 Tax=Drosophila mojavensis TaxID=7230 RepID=UPI001CD0AA7F|nr:uncharacterized protein LOC6572122 [Drosophila mojavensis]
MQQAEGAHIVCYPLGRSQCDKVASCFYSCLGCARNVAAAAAPDVHSDAQSTTALPNCLTYRQVTGAGFIAGSAPARRVPVLFSTNRGLYLRVARPASMLSPLLTATNQQYDISFCDLERWSTNRANVISLEDTFSMLQPQPQPQLQHQQQQQQTQPLNSFAVYNIQR